MLTRTGTRKAFVGSFVSRFVVSLWSSVGTKVAQILSECTAAVLQSDMYLYLSLSRMADGSVGWCEMRAERPEVEGPNESIYSHEGNTVGELKLDQKIIQAETLSLLLLVLIIEACLVEDRRRLLNQERIRRYSNNLISACLDVQLFRSAETGVFRIWMEIARISG